MTLEELFDHGADTAKTLFEKQGHIVPMWIAEAPDGELMPFVCPSLGDKDAVIMAVKTSFKHHNVVRFVSMLEAWVLEGIKEVPESVKRGGSISAHPERKEIIHINAEGDGRLISGCYYILRPEHGDAKLSPLNRHGELEHQTGRFCNLLADKPTEH